MTLFWYQYIFTRPPSTMAECDTRSFYHGERYTNTYAYVRHRNKTTGKPLDKVGNESEKKRTRYQLKEKVKYGRQ